MGDVLVAVEQKRLQQLRRQENSDKLGHVSAIPVGLRPRRARIRIGVLGPQRLQTSLLLRQAKQARLARPPRRVGALRPLLHTDA